MRDLGLAGAVRGRRFKTTVGDSAATCPPDRVNCHFTAARPTWLGVVFVAFVIDVFARRIVGWRVSHLRNERKGII